MKSDFVAEIKSDLTDLTGLALLIMLLFPKINAKADFNGKQI